jgi:UDP-N-acetylglucosamine--N-acetylmuramyl-(pentapeptide) pyrophosphoryl-undecaprenol N-acetylglucosamine transferase
VTTTTPLPRSLGLAVTGGGTGGHTYPALTVIRVLRDRLAKSGGLLDVLWVGSEDGLEAKVATSEGIAFAPVVTGKIRRSSNPLKLASPANLRDMARVPLGVAQAKKAISDFRPDVVLATGGYVAVPAGLAARMCRRPLVLHEQTVRLGLANRKLASSATLIALSSESSLGLLPQAMRRLGVVTGNPIRSEILSGHADGAIMSLGLQGFDQGLPTVYVTGGAQGSQQINAVVSDSLAWILQRANVIHQCGPGNVEAMRAGVGRLPGALAGRYHLTDFIGPELPDVLALCDVMISRSGAGTLAEVTALGKAALFIPLATAAGSEQAHNARHLVDAGAAAALLDEVTPASLRKALEPLLTNPEIRQSLAARARTHGRPDAADRLADVVLSAVAS